MRRTLALLLGALVLAATAIAPAVPASASPWGCQFDSPYLTWTAKLKNPTKYLNPAQWAATYWQQTPTPIVMAQISGDGDLWVADGNFGNTNYVGIVHDTRGNDPFLTCSAGFWSGPIVAWWNSYHTNNYTGEMNLSIMVHEMGHALGLGHESHEPCAETNIMEPSTTKRYNCSIYKPQARDIYYINVIY